jgi:hypothetical protein
MHVVHVPSATREEDMGFEGQLSDADRACMHERDERSDEETAAELLEVAHDAQSMAKLLYDDYRCYRDRDGYPHILIEKQERCAKASARARALYDMAAAEVQS